MGALEDLARDIISAPGFDPAAFDPERFVAALPAEQRLLLYQRAEAEAQRRRTNRFEQFFPDEGPFRRELYPKHLEFFGAGKTHTERLFQAGNRVGKTIAGAYETTAHMTGRYPHWWKGREFNRPTHGWAAGNTYETTRDIIQKELFGEVAWNGNDKSFDGTGMVPKELIGPVKWRRSVADLADVVKIRHTSGR